MNMEGGGAYNLERGEIWIDAEIEFVLMYGLINGNG